MSITPDQRARLNRLMNDRRLALGVTWRDVATRAGLSYEALRKLRTGPGGIRDLTAAQISKALDWEPASVRDVLAGGDPTEASHPDGGQLRAECEFERRILASDVISDSQKKQLIAAHRAEGHGWCRSRPAESGLAQASLPGLTRREGAPAAAG